MKNNNKGFSLIELIVAVLILGIISTGLISGVSTIYNARAERASQVIGTVLKQARKKALALNNTATDQIRAEICFDDGQYYANVYTGTEQIINEKVGNDSLIIKFVDHSTGNAVTVDDANTINIYFKKSTGGISSIMNGSNPIDADQIFISGLSDERKLILVEVTGRCYTTD